MKIAISFLISFMSFILHAQDRGFITPKGAERRIALVVGNLNYQHTKKLTNSLNDANDMAAALEKLGFEVIKITDADYRSFIGGLNRFKDKLKTSDIAFFYYAGHGVSYNNKNYLLPTDASIECLENIEEYGVSLNRILVDIAAKNVKNSFVLLDACRNMPDLRACDAKVRDIDGNSSLVRPTNNPMGSMVIYATEEGSKAEDLSPNGRNGLFTGALLKYLTIPDLTLKSIIDQTSLEVFKLSGGKQTPARYDKIYGDFYFVKKSSTTLLNGVSTKKFMDLPFAEMVYVQGGTFEMGDTRNEGLENEKPVHTVTVSDFWMGKYEVTQAQWESIMGSNPSYFKDCPNCPVESVSWEDVQAFLKRLNAKTGSNYCLPTEAEWEYAAGGGNIGNRTRFGNGKDTLYPNEANFNGEAEYKQSYSEVGVYRAKMIEVGSLQHPNSMGLYDMVGNVMEWCSDWFGSNYYERSPRMNPTGARSGTFHVLRGGSGFNPPKSCRVTNRYFNVPSNRSTLFGFRIVSSM